jgi:hypothetical protein
MIVNGEKRPNVADSCSPANLVETLRAMSLQAGTGASIQTQIDLSRYANGVYFIKAVADGDVIGVRKAVKQ